MSEQPAPTTSPWSQTVDITGRLENVLREQQQKGMATYGTSLQTFNGRRAYQDAIAELVDAAQYLAQLEAERSSWEWRYRSVRDDIERAMEHLLAGRNGDATRVLAHALEYGLP